MFIEQQLLLKSLRAERNVLHFARLELFDEVDGAIDISPLTRLF